MNDPTSYTDVIDAFDEGDSFDLNAHVGYTAHQRSRHRSSASSPTPTPTSGGARRSPPVSRSSASSCSAWTSGLYKDVMAFLRLPLILSDARQLKVPSGSSAEEINDERGPLYDPFDYGGATGPPFSVPFKSPTRAGFDYIGIGGAWAVLNQQRHSWQPTWIFLLEGRRAIGTPLKPCQQVDGKTVCGNQAPGRRRHRWRWHRRRNRWMRLPDSRRARARASVASPSRRASRGATATWSPTQGSACSSSGHPRPTSTSTRAAGSTASSTPSEPDRHGHPGQLDHPRGEPWAPSALRARSAPDRHVPRRRARTTARSTTRSAPAPTPSSRGRISRACTASIRTRGDRHPPLQHQRSLGRQLLRGREGCLSTASRISARASSTAFASASKCRRPSTSASASAPA